MKFLWVVLTSFLFSSLSFSQDIKLPFKITGKPGEFIRIPAQTNGQNVGWYAVTPGLNIFPVDLLKDSKTAVVTAIKEGTYKIIAYTSVNNLVTVPPAECIIEINSSNPGPNPNPDPPNPDPIDESVKKLAKAWELDGKDKEVLLKIIKLIDNGGSCLEKKDIFTLGLFVDCLKDEFDKVLGLGQSLNARREVTRQFFEGMPTDLTLFLSDELKNNIRNRLKLLSNRLNSLKG